MATCLPWCLGHAPQPPSDMHDNTSSLIDGKNKWARACGVQQVGDDLEGVALVDEELLPLGAVEHLLRVLGDQRVEEGVELVRALPARLALPRHARMHVSCIFPLSCCSQRSGAGQSCTAPGKASMRKDSARQGSLPV